MAKIPGILVIAILAGLTCLAADPYHSVKLDLNNTVTPVKLDIAQSEQGTWRVYLYAEDEPWYPSSTNYGGLMGYATNFHDSAAISIATSHMTVATNYIDFSTTATMLNTSGVFYAQVVITNGSGSAWMFGDVELTIRKSPIIKIP